MTSQRKTMNRFTLVRLVFGHLLKHLTSVYVVDDARHEGYHLLGCKRCDLHWQSWRGDD